MELDRTMTPEPLIRPETESDSASIRAIANATFEGKPYAAGDEAELVDRLRAKDSITV